MILICSLICSFRLNLNFLFIYFLYYFVCFLFPFPTPPPFFLSFCSAWFIFLLLTLSVNFLWLFYPKYTHIFISFLFSFNLTVAFNVVAHFFFALDEERQCSFETSCACLHFHAVFKTFFLFFPPYYHTALAQKYMEFIFFIWVTMGGNWYLK